MRWCSSHDRTVVPRERHEHRLRRQSLADIVETRARASQIRTRCRAAFGHRPFGIFFLLPDFVEQRPRYRFVGLKAAQHKVCKAFAGDGQ